MHEVSMIDGHIDEIVERNKNGMTYHDIIKALYCCQTAFDKQCAACPYKRFKTSHIAIDTCSSRFMADLLELYKNKWREK